MNRAKCLEKYSVFLPRLILLTGDDVEGICHDRENWDVVGEAMVGKDAP